MYILTVMVIIVSGTSEVVFYFHFKTDFADVHIYLSLCRIWGRRNRRTPFPDRMLQQATKPGICSCVCV